VQHSKYCHTTLHEYVNFQLVLGLYWHEDATTMLNPITSQQTPAVPPQQQMPMISMIPPDAAAADAAAADGDGDAAAAAAADADADADADAADSADDADTADTADANVPLLRKKKPPSPCSFLFS
jgi:hypothetical protein